MKPSEAYWKELDVAPMELSRKKKVLKVRAEVVLRLADIDGVKFNKTIRPEVYSHIKRSDDVTETCVGKSIYLLVLGTGGICAECHSVNNSLHSEIDCNAAKMNTGWSLIKTGKQKEFTCKCCQQTYKRKDEITAHVDSHTLI